MEKTIRIDPKMFINKPYTNCPKCGGPGFGVLGIYRRHYIKRCVDCRYDEHFSLPPVAKKIVYLDQFVISEMMKSINTELGKTAKVKEFYLELFKKLDRLNKLQLIVCPDSPIHEDESRISSEYKELKRMFEQLSHGTTFYHPDIVKRFQIHNLFKKWIGEEPEPLDVYDFLQGGGDIDGWDSRLIISVSSTMSESAINGIRMEKTSLSSSMKEVVDGWRRDKLTFKDLYVREIGIFGPSLVKRYWNDLINFEKGLNDPNELNNLLLSSVFSEVNVLMTSIHEDLKTAGFADEEIYKKSFEFFKSDLIKEVPYAKIASILYASLGSEYSFGRKKYPTPGFFNDVATIAAYAPYCDAMFIDNECRRLLTHKEAIPIYDLSRKVFSLDTKEDFLEYLDKIESSSSEEHLKLVHQVYGEDWPEPFVDMYNY